MLRVRIAEVASEPSTWNPQVATSGEMFRYIDISSIDPVDKSIAGVVSIAPSEAPSRARQLVRGGDVLVSTVRPNLNAVALVPSELEGATASTGFAVLRPDTARVDSRYLYYWVRSRQFVKEMTARASGASYPAVTEAVVRDSRLPLPPVAEQRRIAAVLDQANAIRQKRRESLQLMDDLLRSVFLTRFGDPLTNANGWDQRPLREITTITTGNTPSRRRAEYYGHAIEWIKSDNINIPGHYVTTATERLSREGLGIARTAGRNAILMTCIAGSRDCIGNVALTNRVVAFNQQISAIEVRPGTDYRFLYVQLRIEKRLVQRASTASMKGLVSKSRLEAVRVVTPPYEAQMEFGEWFSRWYDSYSRQREADGAAVALLIALSNQAFRGELTSR
jgi:type I restriction enzyme S subunit